MEIIINSKDYRSEITAGITGRISKFESLGAVDGPGLRYVVFFQGCNLRCACCHNPETWEMDGENEYDSQEVLRKVVRYRNYYGENGGVTFSGGEPLMQAEFLMECAKSCKDNGIHTILDTSGSILNEQVIEALKYVDLVMLDIKMTNEEDYMKYTNGSFADTIKFLTKLQELGKDVWIRQVIIPTINDSEENAKKIKAICTQYKCIKRLEFLPFKKLCEPKYKQLGITFRLSHIQADD